MYKENEWNEKNVSKLIMDNKESIIFISTENENLVNLISNVKDKGDPAADNAKQHYIENIAFFTYLQYTKYLQSENSTEDEMNKIELTLQNASETIVGALKGTLLV